MASLSEDAPALLFMELTELAALAEIGPTLPAEPVEDGVTRRAPRPPRLSPPPLPSGMTFETPPPAFAPPLS